MSGSQTPTSALNEFSRDENAPLDVQTHKKRQYKLIYPRKVGVAPVEDKTRKTHLRWFGYVEQRLSNAQLGKAIEGWRLGLIEARYIKKVNEALSFSEDMTQN